VTIFTGTFIRIGDHRWRICNSRPIRADRKGDARNALKNRRKSKSCYEYWSKAEGGDIIGSEDDGANDEEDRVAHPGTRGQVHDVEGG
jgi:hypothetical protein